MRDIREIQSEVREIADGIRINRARLVRLVAELERDHMTRDEAWLQMVEDKAPPNVPYHLLGYLDSLEEQDFANIEGVLSEAATVTDETLAESWRNREQLQPAERR